MVDLVRRRLAKSPPTEDNIAMIRRIIEPKLRLALRDTRVVLLNGPRQAGKTTLAKEAASQGGRYWTLDDPTVAMAAKADPGALVAPTAGLTIIDEVQHAPALFAAIKRVVDDDHRPGQFLLTGSANVFLLPRLSESLAGRMEVLTLHPLAQAEVEEDAVNLIDRLVAGKPLHPVELPLDRLDVCQRIVRGGFPEASHRAENRRNAWFASYVASLLQRDIRDLANVEGLTDMPRLLSLLAARTSALLNVAELSRALDIPHSTMRRYLALLEATFLFTPLLPWAVNLGKRLVKSPKIHLIDTGLIAHLRGESSAQALTNAPALGPLLEAFVVQEIRKQIAASDQILCPFHYRTASGQEVDLVVEAAGGKLVGIEVKSSSTLRPEDVRGLQALAEAAGPNFRAGFVFYLGKQVLPLGAQCWALPVSALWCASKLA